MLMADGEAYQVRVGEPVERAASTAVRCSGESGFTASRRVTPEARRARGSSHS